MKTSREATMSPVYLNSSFVVVLTIALWLRSISAGMDNIHHMRSIVNHQVLLPCFFNTSLCGSVHNIKWYKNNARVYLYSPLAGIDRAEGYLTRQGERTAFVANATPSYLRLARTIVNDEGLYRCDVTYMLVKEQCITVTITNLTILEPPAPPEVSLEQREILNGSTIGPINEAELVNLTCRSRKGRPLPEVSWWNGWTKLDSQMVHADEEFSPYSDTSNSLQPEENVGRQQAVNFLRLEITRKYLNSTLQCRVQNDALPEPLISSFKLDVHVRPISLELSGAQSPMAAGTPVRLVCTSMAAKPPAVLTWMNGSSPLHPQPHAQTSPAGDGTYTTQSMLSFTATHMHNGMKVSCIATNRVMQDKHEKPFSKSIDFEVLYPPIVTLSPEGNMTVQEGDTATITCAYVSNPRQITGKRWLRDDRPLRLGTHLEIMDGVADQMKLVFHNVTRGDQGVYGCQVRNSVGTGISAETFTLDVQYPPEVVMEVVPRAVVEGKTDVRLRCTVIAGNPTRLDRVTWYKDGVQLNGTHEAELPLGQVTRAADGNYSCRGRNRLGWSEISPERSLIVTYPPGSATLTFTPTVVIKRKSVTLSCSVDDPGKPSKIQYRWSRGQRVIAEVVSGSWTIEPVTLETQGNFTCSAVNEVGGGPSATVHIVVYAPPSFIDRLPHYYGALMTSAYVNISCRVECDPLCDIHWYKNGMIIDSTRYYTITTDILPPDSSTDDFRSVVSTLVWNLSALPGGRLDRHANNANYTCSSSDNLVGPGVTSTAYFRVEYPPENITVSAQSVDVVEGETPTKIRVRCRAHSYPESSYRWIHRNQTVWNGEVLQFPLGIVREHSGTYTCIASNRHGQVFRDVFVNVLYKPDCRMYQRPDPRGLITLICEGLGNPPIMDFSWVLDNVSLEDTTQNYGLHSILSVPNTPQYYGTYYCTANNTQGTSSTCLLDISGTLGWLETFGDDSMIKLLGAIGGIVVLIVAVSGVILMKCRRTPAKYNSSVELEERDSIEGQMQLVEPLPPDRTMLPSDRSNHQLLKYPSLELTTQDLLLVPDYHSNLPIQDRHQRILWPR